MNDDEHEKLRLKSELQELKRERESEKKSMWVVWFLAIWLLPLLGMQLVQGDDLPKTAGPDFHVVGHMSIWGMWFLGVPLATFLYRKFMR
ncbi:MAG TPA: hypothetical protein VEL06_01355 [Haliangiales bacterium]|nr:hypothetical protein [Haliangiales bacterium]